MDERLSVTPSELNQALELITGKELEVRINELSKIEQEDLLVKVVVGLLFPLKI